MSRILMVASEAVPFAKSGGLADVVGALPPALAGRGEEVAVVLPRYGFISLDRARRVWENLTVWLGLAHYRVDIFSVVERGVEFFLIDCPMLYDRPGLYSSDGRDYWDNHTRFGVLPRAALEVARLLFRPRILHIHDWQASLAAPLLRHNLAGDPTFLGVKVLLTIHNLGYQGRFGRDTLPYIGIDSALFRPDLLEFYGDVNLLKGGIVFADAINTVSPTYAREIQTPEQGFGLDGLLRARSGVLCGILNGVDYEHWNPGDDPLIAANYTPDDLSGKLIDKRDLLAEFGLPADNLERPVIGMVSRLAAQKGFDILEPILGEILAEDVTLIILGTGEPHYEWLLARLPGDYPGKAAVRIAYDNGLAHKIEAGSDMFLMPSHYEPCGLNQMYSLRYGTVPIVRATGGLEDTIDAETGFKFADYTSDALLDSVREALAAYRNREHWSEMTRRGMAQDYSWNASAVQYSELYRRLG